jgi:hypothetical protein
MKAHTDSIRQPVHDRMPTRTAVTDRRAMHRPGRRGAGLHRLRPYRATLICRLWHALFPRAAHYSAPGAAPREGACATPSQPLRQLAQNIVRHVVRRTRRDLASATPRRAGGRPARPAGRGGSSSQRYGPCGGMPAAARDGTGQ